MFQRIPPKLMLIMRNLNTIRAIIKVRVKHLKNLGGGLYTVVDRNIIIEFLMYLGQSHDIFIISPRKFPFLDADDKMKKIRKCFYENKVMFYSSKKTIFEKTNILCINSDKQKKFQFSIAIASY